MGFFQGPLDLARAVRSDGLENTHALPERQLRIGLDRVEREIAEVRVEVADPSPQFAEVPGRSRTDAVAHRVARFDTHAHLGQHRDPAMEEVERIALVETEGLRGYPGRSQAPHPSLVEPVLRQHAEHPLDLSPGRLRIDDQLEAGVREPFAQIVQAQGPLPVAQGAVPVEPQPDDPVPVAQHRLVCLRHGPQPRTGSEQQRPQGTRDRPLHDLVGEPGIEPG